MGFRRVGGQQPDLIKTVKRFHHASTESKERAMSQSDIYRQRTTCTDGKDPVSSLHLDDVRRERADQGRIYRQYVL